jgi:uncharacterized protein with ACT and thioredoxin-like domain
MMYNQINLWKLVRRAKKTIYMEVEEATQTPACCNKLTTLELIMAVKILTCNQEVVSLFL